MIVSSAKTLEFRQRHSSLLNTDILAARSNDVQWGKRLHSLKTDYSPFHTVDILNIRGVPPLMGSHGGPNTKSALIKIMIELLKDLPPASSILEAQEQVKTTLRFVYESGKNRRIAESMSELFNQIDFGNTPALEIVGKLSTNLDDNASRQIPYFGYDAPFLMPLTILNSSKGEVLFLGKSYISHGLIIGRNGSVQVLSLPTSNQLIDMFENDPRAKQYILENQPLDKDEKNGIPPVFFGDENELFSHLRNEELLKQRVTNGKDSDVNKLFRNAPFDFPRHIRAGRLKVVLDKVGADGLTVWQNTHDDFYISLRRLDKERKNRIPKIERLISDIISA